MGWFGHWRVRCFRRILDIGGWGMTLQLIVVDCWLCVTIWAQGHTNSSCH